jgi:alkyldihydroxyacetonephosphate synthase
MTNKPNRTLPGWIDERPQKRTFRSIFKWGDPSAVKHPSAGFLDVIKSELELTQEDFAAPCHTGDRRVEGQADLSIPSGLVERFENIVGKENLSCDTYDRLRFSTGKSMEDILNLRHNTVSHISDLVLHPRTRDEVAQIVGLCHETKIPVHVFGGGSSVTLGLSCPKGGVTLVMATHMNKVVEFNETNQTITVEAGMAGPVYEDLLNRAPQTFGAAAAYTGGHFPQSFEFSSVGGWVVTLGSGQASSLYGDAYDLVVAQTVVTPTGVVKTRPYPATATGPKINDMLKGAEGCFGVLTSVTLKIFPHYPEAAKPFSFMFPDFEKGVDAARQISQKGFGMPAILRLSDAEETDVALKMYGLNKGILDRWLRFKGLLPGKRCLLMGQTQGHPAFSNAVFKQIKKTCARNKGTYLTGYPMKKWYKGRFSDPYMRDSLNDFGILIDTLEASVTWDRLHELHQNVRAYIKSHPRMICMTHASHFYAQGTNLYFIFITRMQEADQFIAFQRGIIQKIIAHHGSLSHHHGVGKMMGPLMTEHLGQEQMAVLKALKSHFDPGGIMNPGGMGL